MGVLSPPQHIENEDFVAQSQLARKAVDYMLGQVIATGFHCHAKLMDLK
jgi:hypothetical protein